MIRYHLDDLGWYQFEWLIQSLLKATYGLGVESWGGTGDYGKDAYSSVALKFSLNRLNKGPFLFQVKFVQNANAAGANSDTALIAAVAKEKTRIEERRSHKKWKDPRYYILFTNSPIHAKLRSNLTTSLQQTLKNTSIHLFGGTDVCDMLDNHENLRRSFPQLVLFKKKCHVNKLGCYFVDENREEESPLIDCASKEKEKAAFWAAF
jgi:hypothetical protein